MKKGFLLIIAILLLSGCTVEYNVNFTKNSANELVILNNVTDEVFPVEAYYNEQGASETPIEIEGIEYYDITKSANATNLTYNFPIDRYPESKGANLCYKNVSINKMNDGSFNLLTTKYNSCIDYYPELEQIIINLKFTNDFNITRNNADKVDGNTYTWIIDRNNYNNKGIELSYAFKEEAEEEQINEKSSKYNILIILGSFLVLGVIIAIVIKLKNKKVNS